jgi:hypothetical protein
MKLTEGNINSIPLSFMNNVNTAGSLQAIKFQSKEKLKRAAGLQRTGGKETVNTTYPA